MTKMIVLNKAVKYSNRRVDIRDIVLENFVTTDNLLPNKLGISNAINLPPQSGNIPSFQAENILVGNIRPYLKKIWFADRNGGCSADVLVFNVNEGFIPKFIFYSLFRDDFFNHMMNGSKGTKMPRGDKNQILNFTIPDFGISTQKKIANVLSALDSKIELNNRINTELEAMAKTLYDYWFVQFDFPDKNGKPYKSSGGKMLFNDKLKRDIPIEWSDGVLGDLITLEYGKPLKAETRTGVGYPVVGSSGIVGCHSKYLVQGPGVVVGRKGTIGAITYLFHPFFPIDTTYFVKPKQEIKFLYLNYLLRSLGLEMMNGDSAVPGLNREVALGIGITKAPLELVQKYESIVGSFFRKKESIYMENQQLTQLRDWLLPMLMNGQVRVN